MPALVFLNRRWRIGSDDFVLPGLVELAIRIAWLILVMLLFIQHEQVQCTSGSSELRIYLIGVLVLLSVVIIITSALVYCSGKGGVMEEEARKAVSVVLTIRVTLAFPEVAWNLMGSIWIFTGQINCNDHAPLWIMLKALLIMTWVALFLLFVLIMILFEPMQRPESQLQPSASSYTLDGALGSHYIQLWERRCRILCCTTSKDETSLEALRNVADVLASIFEDNDLVASDIAAALVLLRLKFKYQEQREKRKLSRRVRKALEKKLRKKINPQSASNAASLESQDGEVIDQPITSEPLECGQSAVSGVDIDSPSESDLGIDTAPPPPHSWMTLHNAHHFMKFALAVYGWPWFMYGRCCVGFLKLWPFLQCCTPCMCRNAPDFFEGDNCCLCHTAAMKSVTGLDDEDFLYMHFSNDVYQVPFFVAIDSSTESIVIAIRGTMSLKDTITDMTAQTANVYLPQFDLKGDEELKNSLAHKGMVNAANFVYDNLVKSQSLLRALMEKPGYQIVITGHSLGAGAGVILAAKLKLRQSEIVKELSKASDPDDGDFTGIQLPPLDALLRQSNIVCYSYSPPGGLCSPIFYRTVKDYVFSVCVGDDIVPRLSMTSLHQLRENIFTVLKECKQPKYRLLAQGCWYMLFGISEKNLRKGFQEVYGSERMNADDSFDSFDDITQTTTLDRRSNGTQSTSSSAPLLYSNSNTNTYDSLSESPHRAKASSDSVLPSHSDTEEPSPDHVTPSDHVSVPMTPSCSSVQTIRPRHTETRLCLPGHVMFIRPASVKKPNRWHVSWRSPCDFQDLVISPWMMRHHLPQEVMAALAFAVKHNKVPTRTPRRF